MLGPDGGEGSETTRGIDIADDTNNDDWWGFNDGTGLDDFLLVQF